MQQIIRLPDPIQFKWDNGNRNKNWLKHQVSSTEAEEVFFDADKKLAKAVFYTTTQEKRFILLGKTRLGRLLFVVFTIRDKKIRVISARNINRKERPLYETGKPRTSYEKRN
ncbi:MAG: BrnT family toxin [Chloroflexi bacterium]|nr:BrnT family toxin [Chloroflexota bacterium]